MMSADELKWIVGLILGIVTPAFGGIVLAFRSVHNKISSGNNLLHQRIHSVEKEYVRSDRLDSELSHLNKRLDDMKQDSQNRHRELLDEIRGLK